MFFCLTNTLFIIQNKPKMDKNVLNYLNKCQGWKTACTELHWDSNSISQHELCDKIADTIADHEDKIAEVEQSISGKLTKGNLKPIDYKVTSLKKFVEDVLDDSNTFLKEIEGKGDTYVGMKSDVESFISDMQRNLYLVNFTLKENKQKRIKVKLTENDLHRLIKESVNRILTEMERSKPSDLPPGDDDIYYPGDINPDVLDSLQRGDFGDTEDVMAFDVFTGNLDLNNRREREKVLLSTLYDKNDNPIGKLNDFHFKYNPDSNEFV